MPSIVADVVDAYVFRRLNARLQFLLLLRRADLAMGNTWQGIHERIEPGESALGAARRGVLASTALVPSAIYSTDFVNQAYDHARDAIILAPVFAIEVPPRARAQLGEEFGDWAWCDREEATARLVLSGQRWAVRHIDEVIGLGGADAEFYRVGLDRGRDADSPLHPSHDADFGSEHGANGV